MNVITYLLNKSILKNKFKDSDTNYILFVFQKLKIINYTKFSKHTHQKNI